MFPKGEIRIKVNKYWTWDALGINTLKLNMMDFCIDMMDKTAEASLFGIELTDKYTNVQRFVFFGNASDIRKASKNCTIAC